MALSNIFREPRREITEQAVGMLTSVVIAVPIVWADYQFADWLYRATGQGKDGMPIPIGMILGMCALVVAAMLSFLVMMIVHAIGEHICDAFENRGVYLRPKQRYRRR